MDPALLLPRLGICAIAIATLVAATNRPANSQTSVEAMGGGELTRPTDFYRWVTLGTTLRLSGDGAEQPDEMRHIQVRPEAYDRFKSEGKFPDGATFAATFYGLERTGGQTPAKPGERTLYAQRVERALSLEVLDSRHPDGRRFYVFRPGAASVKPLPAGNVCAACHNATGAMQGTFAQYYPAMAPR